MAEAPQNKVAIQFNGPLAATALDVAYRLYNQLSPVQPFPRGTKPEAANEAALMQVRAIANLTVSLLLSVAEASVRGTQPQAPRPAQ